MMLLRLFLLLSAVNFSSVMVGMEHSLKLYAQGFDSNTRVGNGQCGVVSIKAVGTTHPVAYQYKSEAIDYKDVKSFIQNLGSSSFIATTREQNKLVVQIANQSKLYIHVYSDFEEINKSYGWLGKIFPNKQQVIHNPRIIVFSKENLDPNNIQNRIPSLLAWQKDGARLDPFKDLGIEAFMVLQSLDDKEPLKEEAKVITSINNQHWLKTWFRAHPFCTYLSLLGLFSLGFATFLYMKHKH